MPYPPQLRKGFRVMARTYRAQKAALTRAQNSGDPQKVRAEVSRFLDEYRNADMPLPDNWHRWIRAREDANFAERYAR